MGYLSADSNVYSLFGKRQVGLGDNVTLPTITVPTEVILWRMAPPRTRMKCVDVSAGGDVTCFTVEKTTQTEMSSSKSVELLLCGNGQYGSLGNNAYTNAQGSPIRARNVSNLTECMSFIIPSAIMSNQKQTMR